MADTAVRLYGPAVLTNSAATKYTVGGGVLQTIVKRWRFCNTSASIVNVTVSIGADATGTRIYDEFAVPANGIVVEDSWNVLTTGEIVQAFASTASVVTFTMDGVEVS